MERKSLLRNTSFWLALMIVLAAIYLAAMAHSGQLDFLDYVVWTVPVHHWFSWIGGAFIVLFTPVFYFLKRRYRKNYQAFMQIHVFGDLIAFLLVSVHFGHHVQEYFTLTPHPGTGLPLFIAEVSLVGTGILMRFQVAVKRTRTLRSLHTGMMMALYLIILFHILRGTLFFIIRGV